MTEKHLSSEQEIENTLFTQHLRTTVYYLKRRDIVGSFVGGSALYAISGKAMPARRKNGTIYDLDFLATGPNSEVVRLAQRELRHISRTPAFWEFPEIGMETILFGERPRFNSPLALLSYTRVENNRCYLGYGDIEEEIPLETMQTQERLLNGVSVPIFPRKTIAYRYLTRGCAPKLKDEQKLTMLWKHIRDNPEQEFGDEYYKPYINFVNLVQERYPARV